MIRKEFEQEKGRSCREPEHVLWLENELIEARQERNLAVAILDYCLPGWTEKAQIIMNEMQKEEAR